MSTITAPQIPCKSVGETRNEAYDFTPELADGELLTGTPTVVEVTTSDLTITNVSLNTENTTILNKDVLASRAVQWSVAGGVADTTYTLRITAATDATPAQTIIRKAKLKVIAN